MKIMIAVAVVSGLAGSWLTNTLWQSKWNAAELAASQAQIKAVEAAITQYKNRITSLEVISRDTNEKLQAALADADNADITANSLQQQIDDYVRRGSGRTCNSSSTSERAAVATEQLLLAELFKRADRRAGVLAKIADENRIRGLACESAYNSLK